MEETGGVEADARVIRIESGTYYVPVRLEGNRAQGKEGSRGVTASYHSLINVTVPLYQDYVHSSTDNSIWDNSPVCIFY